MRWNETVELGVYKEEKIKGETIKSYDYHMVFANTLTFGYNEHYEFEQLGMRPEYKIEVRQEDFILVDKVKFRDKEYYVLTTKDNFKKGTVVLTISSNKREV